MILSEGTYSGDYNIVMSHIRNLREKIEDNPSKTDLHTNSMGSWVSL